MCGEYFGITQRKMIDLIKYKICVAKQNNIKKIRYYI